MAPASQINKANYNNMEGNKDFGIFNAKHPTSGTWYYWEYEKYSPPDNIVDGTFNWWGHETGPYHNTTWTYKGEPYGSNYGLGDRVSDYVLYDPWLEYSWPAPPPTIKVEPSSYQAKLLNETFSVNITISDLSVGWRVVGFHFRLSYNNTLLEVVNVEEGPFLQDPRWNLHGTFFISFVEDDGVYGPHIVVGSMLYPNDTGFWEAYPSRSGVIATLTFRVIYQERGYSVVEGYIKPPLTCNLTLIETILINDEEEEILHNIEHGLSLIHI